ncbi:MAG: GspH/FimT family pseudopilin [Thiobacillus sp.]|nr:GspH/FimT family pseudopilin [Thiobacillus sp.]
MNTMQTRPAGFTLIELMVTLSVLAILLTIGIPSLQMFIQNSRLQSQSASLMGDLNYARAEAVRLGSPVAVCASADGATCSGALTWETGWVVFNDINNPPNNVVDAGELLRAAPALGGGNTLRAANPLVRFNALGYSNGFGATFSVCDTRGLGNARGVILSNHGRVRSGKATDAGFGTVAC